MKLRLGAVAFLNARPLVASLAANPRFDVTFSVPSACALQLRNGAIDVGQIPSIDYARSPEPYFIVPHVAIGSRREVLTVRLYHKKPVRQIRRVALDLSSLTSVALLRILLAEHYSVEPEFVDASPDLEAMLQKTDAALLIGDSVFGNLDTKVESVDLGRLWADVTDLPFVYAFWAGREGALSASDVSELIRSARDGEREIPRIAAEFAGRSANAERYESYTEREYLTSLSGNRSGHGLERFYSTGACAWSDTRGHRTAVLRNGVVV